MQELQNNIHELFIARDIMDMANEYAKDFYILEQLSDFTFNLARLHEDSTVDWDTIFSILDQAYSNKNASIIRQLEPIYRKINASINNSHATKAKR